MTKSEVTSLSRLVDHFRRLPGIGRKTAQRLAFYVLSLSIEEAEAFAGAIVEAKEKIRPCSVCQNLTDEAVCAVCADERRDGSVVCVVEQPQDVLALERMHEYKGLYHVLHGAISPMDRVGPDDIRIKELLSRIQKGGINEVILATNPTLEGDATAMYISRLIKPLGLKVTRLAYGIPVGGVLEYADEITLLRAFEGRREY